MNAATLFVEALTKSDPKERAAFLDAACAGQPEVRAAVDALIDVNAKHTGAVTLDSPLPTRDYAAKHGEPGNVIAGRYLLSEKIGEGGMGEVWAAHQTEPVKRNVAVKLIKAGMDSRAVLARFEAERQVLALMDHPNIAKVFDGGLTDDRHPFFVMELVNGLPLTMFCDRHKLAIRDRLDLFVAICQAVQHAHQKGIIHRDLKPSNILVAELDSKALPKVIDFGVAKAIGGQLTSEDLTAQFGAVVGTYEYMAPEQATRTSHDVDTRADIYSLGVILYELLTGLRPFESKRLRQAAVDDMMRIIREEEPSKPSTKLSMDQSLPTLAAARQMEPKKLTALMRGELDWVVMKCLEKSRERRYATANGLARDIQRYLADEPVEARPPSLGYRTQKFLRRHRGPVLAASLLLLALVAGIVGTTWGLVVAREQERQAQLERTKAVDQERQAQLERTKAVDNAAAALQLGRSLNKYVELVEMGSVEVGGGEKLRNEQLDAAVASYERLLELQPKDLAVRRDGAQMYRMRANLCRFLNQTAKAEESYQQALLLYDQLVAEYPAQLEFRENRVLTLRDYSQFLRRVGRLQEAINIADNCIRFFEEFLREQPIEPRFLRSLANLLIDRSAREGDSGRSAEMEQSARQASALYARLPQTPGARPEPFDLLFHAMAENNLALALREQGRLGDAMTAHDKAHELMIEMTNVNDNRNGRSFLYRVQTERAWTMARWLSNRAAAIAELDSAIKGWNDLNKQRGNNPTDRHRISVASRYSGELKSAIGQRDAARNDFKTAAAILERLLAEQPKSALYQYDLGRTYISLWQLGGDAQEAAEWHDKAREKLALLVKQYPENPQYQSALAELESGAHGKP